MDKDNKHRGSRTIRLPRWFSRKHKGADPFLLSVISDGGEENDDYMDGVDDGSSQMDPYVSTKELRVFVGTWNVAGRSPVGSLAVDLDEWLNLKDAADIYVLGRIFWFGDLNYRLYLEDNMARHFIRQQDWTALQKFDQLRRELDDGGVFQGWKEGNIEFAPTYKYSSSNCNRYSGAIPSRAGEKQRTPAWCDRILWYGKGVRQLSYFRSESKFSDHRPVSALFCTRIEVVKSANPRFAAIPMTFLPRTPSKTNGQENTIEEVPSTLLSLIVGDIEVSPTYMQASISSR